jgi:hypothetical protein
MPLSLTVMQGSALVLLYPSEETYVDFLAINQKVRLNQMALEDEDKVGFSTWLLILLFFLFSKVVDPKALT